MRKRRLKVLAIDPGTRQMGVAFLEGEKLLYHGVKLFPKQPEPHRMLAAGREAVLRLLRDLRPDVLVVEKAFFANNRSAALLNVLVDENRAMGKRRGLTVLSFAPGTVRKAVCGNGQVNKAEIARVVVAKYRELENLFGGEQGMEGKM